MKTKNTLKTIINDINEQYKIRIANCLHQGNILSLQDLLKHSPKSLLKMNNMGKGSVNELTRVLKKNNLNLFQNKVIIEIIWPYQSLNPNSRVHWSKKLKGKNALKDYAFYAAKEAGIPEKKDTYHLKITFYPPDDKHRDLDNCLASFKAGFDGIALAWGVNDKQFRPLTIDFGSSCKNGKVIVEL